MQQKLFYIWGFQWAASGIIDFFSEGSILNTIKLITFLLAVLSSLLIIFLHRSQLKILPQIETQAWRSYKMLFPIVLLLGSLALLWFVAGADNLLILQIIRALLLAFFYVLIGALLGKELIWLGYWLLALIVIVSIWYLGYSPFVFEGMEGLSLLACGWIMRGWNSYQGEIK